MKRKFFRKRKFCCDEKLITEKTIYFSRIFFYNKVERYGIKKNSNALPVVLLAVNEEPGTSARGSVEREKFVNRKGRLIL